MSTDLYKDITIGRAAFYCAVFAIVLSAFCLLLANGGGMFLFIALGLYVIAFFLGVSSLFMMVVTLNFSGFITTMVAIVLSVSPLIFTFVIVGFSARGRQKVMSVQSGKKNLEVLDKALRNYERTYGRLPEADRWCDILLEYDSTLSKESFLHPGAKVMTLKGQCHFAFNKNLSGLKLSDVASDTTFLFWADGPWNLNGGAELLEPEISKYGFIFMTLAKGKTVTYSYNRKSYTEHNSKYNPKPKKLNWKPGIYAQEM